jgi:hypothetical protein
MGRNRTTPASSTAAASGIPSRSFSSMKSTRTMLLRAMTPSPVMKADHAGRREEGAEPEVPMSESGIGTR